MLYNRQVALLSFNFQFIPDDLPRQMHLTVQRCTEKKDGLEETAKGNKKITEDTFNGTYRNQWLMSDVKGLFLKSLAFVTPSTSRTSSNSYRLVFSFVPVISFNHSCLFPFDSQSTTLLLYNTYFFILYILTTNQTKDKLNNFNINLRGYLSLPFPSLFFSFFSFPIHLKLIYFFCLIHLPYTWFQGKKTDREEWTTRKSHHYLPHLQHQGLPVLLSLVASGLRNLMVVLLGNRPSSKVANVSVLQNGL